SAVAVGFMLWYIVTKKPKGLTMIAIAMMAGGAAGNLIDRLVLQYVRDFLSFNIFGYAFPVFNVADVALCIG
ncbi:signal peptidase II, partial [Acinetobacter soli]|uniref:signal peptidase II n=1 Tax=Acinetobacter soli TaxID=487316 RepID=UPI003593778C